MKEISSLIPDKNNPIAYFCMEYAIDEDRDFYAGGLGILAGDYLFEAADKGVPLIALGLHYGGDISEEFSLLEDDDGNDILIDVPIANETIKVRVWHRSFGESVRLMLLDTDLPENSPEDREIDSHIYDSHFYTRLKQQIVLGVGGVRLLKTLKVVPSVYHLNEGHTAFAALAVMAEDKQRRGSIVATKHTILSDAGILIPSEDFKKFVGPYCNLFDIKIEEIFNIGKDNHDPDMFSTTKFLLTSARSSNGVSLIHTVYEKKAHPKSTLIPITNGVYKKRWQAEDWGDSPKNLDDKEIWKIKNALRSQLVSFVKEKTGFSLNPNACTVVWARRFASYKRPELLFSNLKKLGEIVSDEERPVQFIISGKAHSNDREGQDAIKKIMALTKTPTFKDKIVYLSNYDISIAGCLTRGADIWLNTPERGKEACGTSGMKAGLNGGLQCSVSDGWVDEVDWKGKGWVLSEEHTQDDMYNSLSNDIPVLFYKRDSDDIPHEWIKYMRSTIDLVETRYTTERMLHDYLEKVYLF